MKVRRWLATLVFLSITGTAYPQDPSSQQYHTVFLPAHGVGDTKSPDKNLSWGAYSVSNSDEEEVSLSGWAVGYQSEKAASAAALEMCSRRGGINCAINMVFANRCAVVATSDDGTAASRESSLRRARRSAMQACGKNCRILYEGCSDGR